MTSFCHSCGPLACLVVATIAGCGPQRVSAPVADAAAVVGKICEAETTLAPSGYVSLDGRRYEAYSRSGLATKGSRLQVVAVDNFRLIVTQLPT